MAKKDKKDKKKSGKKDKATAGAVEAVDAVRSAVESTFAATAAGAQSLRGPAQEFAGELGLEAGQSTITTLEGPAAVCGLTTTAENA